MAARAASGIAAASKSASSSAPAAVCWRARRAEHHDDAGAAHRHNHAAAGDNRRPGRRRRWRHWWRWRSWWHRRSRRHWRSWRGWRCRWRGRCGSRRWALHASRPHAWLYARPGRSRRRGRRGAAGPGGSWRGRHLRHWLFCRRHHHNGHHAVCVCHRRRPARGASGQCSRVLPCRWQYLWSVPGAAGRCAWQVHLLLRSCVPDEQRGSRPRGQLLRQLRNRVPGTAVTCI